MVSLSLMITYIKHRRESTKDKYFGHSTTSRLILKTMMRGVPHHLKKKYTFKHLPSLVGSESYITLTNFKKGIKRDASAYPIFKNERYYNTFIHHFKATANAQGLNSLMDPNFTPGSDEHEQQLFEKYKTFSIQS